MKNLHKYFGVFTIVILFLSVQLEAQTLSENETKKESINIKLYPNPSMGEFRIEISMEEKGVLTAKLYDMTGKMIEDLSDKVREGSKVYSGDIRLENLSSGIYFLKIESQGKSATKKVIIR